MAFAAAIPTVYYAAAAAVAAVAGAGVSAYGAHEQGVANSNAAAYQAAVATNNQKIAAGYAQAELDKGAALEERKRLATSQQEGAIRASASASGLDVDSGSPLRLQEDTARLGELDAQTIRNNAQKAAYGYQVQGLSFAGQAGLLRSESENFAEGGNLGAFSSIIGGASSVADRWSRYQSVGGGSPPAGP